MAGRKSEADAPVLPPADFHPASNGEFCPGPPTARAHAAHGIWRHIVEEKHRRLGLSRREFAESACGQAAWLLALSQAACGAGGESVAGRPDGSVVGMDVAGYDVDRDMLEDAAKARERLSGDELIFDVQVHVSTPLVPWTEKAPPARALDFIKQIFVQSDTAVACVSGIPAARDLGIQNVQARRQLQEIMDRLAGPRLVLHANADPERSGEPDYMAQVAVSPGRRP